MIPVRFLLSGEQRKGKDAAFCNLTSWEIPAQPQNLEISMTWAHEQGMLVKTQARMIQCVTWEHYAVPPGGLALSVRHILYVPVCVYVFVCAHAILHQREIPSLVPEAWGPVFVVIWKQLHLPEITLGTIQSFLSSAWIMNGKPEISQTPRPAEITTNNPYFWPRCLWHPDEEGNSSVDGEKDLHC